MLAMVGCAEVGTPASRVCVWLAAALSVDFSLSALYGSSRVAHCSTRLGRDPHPAPPLQIPHREQASPPCLSLLSNGPR